MIKTISFDIGGTLIKETENNEALKYDLKSLASLVNKPYPEVRIAYKDVFQKNKGTIEELTAIFCKALNIPIEDKYLQFFKEKFALASSNATVSEEDIELIKDLKNKGYRIILVSNSCCLIPNNLSEELLKTIDGLYYSYDIGYTKSDKELYDFVEKDQNITKEEILHIGDTLNSDYIDPISNGWNALFFGIPKEENVEYIEDLRELYNYLSIKQLKHK